MCSIDKVSRITSVVLVIHGTDDEVIDFSHGQMIYQRCPRTVEPLWVDGAGHNDIEMHEQYLERLIRFIDIELPISWQEDPASSQASLLSAFNSWDVSLVKYSWTLPSLFVVTTSYLLISFLRFLVSVGDGLYGAALCELYGIAKLMTVLSTSFFTYYSVCSHCINSQANILPAQRHIFILYVFIDVMYHI